MAVVTGMTHSPHRPRFDVTVPLLGHEGNAFFILGTVIAALRRAGATDEEVSEFHAEATTGDYDHLLRTVMAWVDVE